MKVTIPRGKSRAATFRALGDAVLSIASQLSPAQEAYQELMRAKCEKLGINHPFELDPNEVKKFFDDLSADWAMQKDGMEVE